MQILSSDIDFMLRHGAELAVILIAALLCGVLLGYERQRKGKPVGIVTASLVALGSTLFAHASPLILEGSATGDATRLPSMIVSGIGFIGAGTIMRSKFSVSGLTSAATIWGLGAVGILIGTGHPVLGLSATVVLYLSLRSLPRLEHAIFRQRFCVHTRVVCRREGLDDVREFLLENQIPFRPTGAMDEDEEVVLAIDECGIESKPELLNSLRTLDGVVGLQGDEPE